MNKQFFSKTFSIFLVFSLVFVGLSIFSPNNIEAKGEKPDNKISICHRTSSVANPWNVINVSINAKDAHLAHGDFIYNGGSDLSKKAADTLCAISSEKELACINSGGTVGTSQCCAITGDFPNNCATGACGCAPEYSHEVKVCYCSIGKCFDGNTCVTECIPGQNLLKNGSFEFPEVTNTSKWQLFPSGTALLEWVVGWVSAAPSMPPKIEIHEGVLVAASDGDQSIELDSDAPTYISQAVNTESGYEYKLSFDFAARPNTLEADNKLEVWADTVLQASISSNTSWQTKTYNFFATTNLTEIKFVDIGIPNTDSMGTLLDNVKLECVSPVL